MSLSIIVVIVGSCCCCRHCRLLFLLLFFWQKQLKGGWIYSSETPGHVCLVLFIAAEQRGGRSDRGWSSLLSGQDWGHEGSLEQHTLSKDTQRPLRPPSYMSTTSQSNTHSWGPGATWEPWVQFIFRPKQCPSPSAGEGRCAEVGERVPLTVSEFYELEIT